MRLQLCSLLFRGFYQSTISQIMSFRHRAYDKCQSKVKGKGDGKHSDIAEDTEEKGEVDGKGIDRGEDSDVAGGTSFRCKRHLLAPWTYEANTCSL